MSPSESENAPAPKRVTVTHFSDTDLITLSRRSPIGVVAGVEAVMRTQNQILQEHGWNVHTVVGAGNPNKDVTIYSPIKSGYFGKEYPSEHEIQQVIDGLRELFNGGPVIAHNSTNARRHNPAYGEAIARLAEERMDSSAPPVILWSHDTRAAEIEDFFRFMPHREGAPIICVSNTRRDELLKKLATVRKKHPDVAFPRDEDVRVLANPINERYLGESFPQPYYLEQLAPNYCDFNEEFELLGKPEKTQELIFNPPPDTLTFIVPARIVVQKGIKEALLVANEVGRLREGKTVLIVTGPSDTRKSENVKYLQEIQELLHTNSLPNVRVIFLGGVQIDYMPWLLRSEPESNNRKVVLMPSTDEGFGLPPLEAASVGTPAIVSDIPAFRETTHAKALLLGLDSWKEPEEAAQAILSYLSTPGLAQANVTELQQIVDELYSPAVIGAQLESLLTEKK